MIILWKSSLSGLADRLMDLYLMATIGKIKDATLYVLWPENKNITDFQFKVWPKSRLLDWKPEVFTEYLMLPSIVKFIDEDEFNRLSKEENYEFKHYLGGIYSPQSFYKKFQSEIKDGLNMHISEDEFTFEFYSLISQLKPTEKFSNLLNLNIRPDISIHLRRTDKVVDNPDAGQIQLDELKFLNEVTKICLDKLIGNCTNDYINLYFCSDDPLVRAQWIKMYKGKKKVKIINSPSAISNFESTYFDLLTLSMSHSIILSQKHSNFSLLASLINQSKLIYFFDTNPMNINGSFKNMELFKPSIVDKIHLKLKSFI
jgi:hypothetical protein